MKRARWIELTTWIVGIALLSSYAALRVSAEKDSREGVQEFQALRNAARAETPGVRPHDPPRPGLVDQSLWSQARVRAFRSTTLHEVPQGILRIPGLGLVVPIYSDTTASQLDRGVGHIQGTAPLDAQGNAAIAGHRDGFFRSLSRIEPGQSLYVETLNGTRRYLITGTRIVAPSDVSVLAPTARPSVTLVTCYPFYFIGPAPRRFIVRAELVRSQRHASVVQAADPYHHQE